MYDNRPVIIAMVASVALLLVVIELVRRRRLREEYSLLWLLTAAALIVLAASRELLDALAVAAGIAYPPSALLMLAFGFMLVILLHFSTVLSRLSDENKKLAQQIAILQYELRQATESAQPDQEEAAE